MIPAIVMKTVGSRADAEALDRTDPLAHIRSRFIIPDGVVYLDGNSLGALPTGVSEHLSEVVVQQWGRDLITSWNEHGWMDMPARVGARIAPLIGALPREVVCADSTSVNVFKLLSAALRLRPDRHTILTDSGNFPTDIYIAGGLSEFLCRRAQLVIVEETALADAIDEDTAVVMATEVNYRTGRRHDMNAVTRAAQERGALVLWDLAHSAGALPVDLDGIGADFAVGCGYKFLNGGPGAPAFLYVAERHLDAFHSPLAGWLGHESPFAFDLEYRPARGIERTRVGTPPVLSMAALEAALSVFDDVEMSTVREKSLAMSELLIALIEKRCHGLDIELVTPRDPERRGSQVSVRHPEAYAVMQALIARGFIGDFRAPDIMRFGLAPLYLRFTDVWDTAETLREVLSSREFERPEYARRQRVT